MVERKTMAIILANMHDSLVGSMTGIRSMASIPFAGRYRLIDFHLSGLVHAGISDVAIIAKENYNSLMRHIGSGKEWDLSRKIDGVQLYPPHVDAAYTSYSSGRINAVHNILPHIEESTSNYVVLLDCDHVCNIDFSALVNDHIKTKADISMLCYTSNSTDEKFLLNNVSVVHDENERVVEIAYHSLVGKNKNYRLSMNVMVLSRQLLIELIENAYNQKGSIFERDILIPGLRTLFIRSVDFEGYVRRIDSIEGYFNTTMSLLDQKNYNALFLKERPIFTKVNDDAPVRYGLNSNLKNSLLADGCVIEGTVENSVLFRGVTVEEGAVVRDCVLMQGTIVKKNATVDYVITDTFVEIKESRKIMGYKTYPLYIGSRHIV